MLDWEALAKRLIKSLEMSHIAEYAEMIGDLKRLIFVSFMSGIFRGLGMAIGFSALGALALLIIGRIFGIELKIN